MSGTLPKADIIINGQYLRYARLGLDSILMQESFKAFCFKWQLETHKCMGGSPRFPLVVIA